MSVCVVAQYPWKAVTTLIGSEPPGLIMSSDTLIVEGRTLQPFDFMLAKQYGISRNLIVCYTSSNVDATLRAVLRCAGISDVKRVGRTLRESHDKYGGATELLACVWSKGGHRPQILEVMPPAYEPRPRTGIVGIGDRAVLQRFKEVFREDPSPHLPIEPTPEMLENISKAVGHPVDFGSRFPIHNAIAEVVSAFTEAIEDVESLTVALPVHALTITKEGYTPYNAVLRSPGNPGKWRSLTTPTDKLSILKPMATRVPRDFAPRKAVQLFD